MLHLIPPKLNVKCSCWVYRLQTNGGGSGVVDIKSESRIYSERICTQTFSVSSSCTLPLALPWSLSRSRIPSPLVLPLSLPSCISLTPPISHTPHFCSPPSPLVSHSASHLSDLFLPSVLSTSPCAMTSFRHFRLSCARRCWFHQQKMPFPSRHVTQRLRSECQGHKGGPQEQVRGWHEWHTWNGSKS